MNLAEYEICLTVRRRVPLDLEPPADVVQSLPDGRPCVDLGALDLSQPDHEALFCAVAENLATIISEREDNEHNEIADRLFLVGQRIAQTTEGVVVELHHMRGFAPGTVVK